MIILWKSDIPGGVPGLQNQWGADKAPGGFDSYLFRDIYNLAWLEMILRARSGFLSPKLI